MQANLPMDSFYALVSDHDIDHDTCTDRVLQVGSVCLRKVLECSDDEFESTQKEWARMVQDRLLEVYPDAKRCQERLNRMLVERTDAIENYGYLSEVAEGGDWHDIV